MSDRDTPHVDDERLSALLDDALSADEARRLRERIARDPALKARMDALARADAAVRSAYSGILDEPLPARVLELLEPTARARADVVELPVRGRKSRFLSLPLAAAAGIALAVGLSLGVLIGPRAPGPDPLALAAVAGEVAPGTDLYAVLQSAPSAASRTLAADISATPRLTFRTTDGGYCRYVDLTNARGTTQTLACRRDGGWRVEVASFMPAAEAEAGRLYRPASGPSEPIDTAIDALIEGSPLAAAEERELIERGWASP